MARTRLPCTENMHLEKTEKPRTLKRYKILHLLLTRCVINKLAENMSTSSSNVVILSSYCKTVTDHFITSNTNCYSFKLETILERVRCNPEQRIRLTRATLVARLSWKPSSTQWCRILSKYINGRNLTILRTASYEVYYIFMTSYSLHSLHFRHQIAKFYFRCVICNERTSLSHWNFITI